MGTRALFAFALLFSLSAVCQAAEKKNDDKAKFQMPSVEVGDYSLKLNTNTPKHLDAPAPEALTPLKQETNLPFVGFSLSRPLSGGN